MGKKLRVGLIIGFSILLVVLILGFIFIVNPIIQMKKNPIEIVEMSEETIIDYNSDKIISDEELEKIETANIQIIKEEKKLDEVINILLVGLDARSYETVSRSDSMMIISYNTVQHNAKIISVMRDSWVYIPEYGWNRINAATAFGGVGLLINTVNRNFDLDIQNYVQIKFEDFRKIIDILDGIDVELTQSEIDYINYKLHTDDKDYENDVKAEPGLVHLNGAQALWHCRNRSVGNSDFARTERQRIVLTLIVEKGLSMGIFQAVEILNTIKDYLNTNMSLLLMTDLVEDAIINKSLDIESYRIPFDTTYGYASKNGASVLSINIQKNAEMLHDILGYEETKEISLPAQPKTIEDIEAEQKLNEEKSIEDVEKIEDFENLEEVENVENLENESVEENISEEIEDTIDIEEIENP